MGAPSRIAVVENDVQTRELLVEVLRDAGFVVEAADDPKALPRSWRGDVILTDTFGTPYRTANAQSVVRRLRDRHHAAIVVLSGHAAAKADEARLGADAVVTKPFDIEELVAIIRSVAGANAGGAN
jgi:two-component system, OmpR family, response regulator